MNQISIRCGRSRPAPSVVTLLLLTLVAGCSGHRSAGTGDVAFRLIWNGRSDLDLFVEDPSGTCIFFGERESASGGLLDVDCNSGTDRMCERPVENVFWPFGTAPPGQYRFWVRAHSLVPAEAPLDYRLQVLRGRDSLWVHEGALRVHQEVQGPFVYTSPDRTVTGPQPRSTGPSREGAPVVAGCGAAR